MGWIFRNGSPLALSEKKNQEVIGFLLAFLGAAFITHHTHIRLPVSTYLHNLPPHQNIPTKSLATILCLKLARTAKNHTKSEKSVKSVSVANVLDRRFSLSSSTSRNLFWGGGGVKSPKSEKVMKRGERWSFSTQSRKVYNWRYVGGGRFVYLVYCILCMVLSAYYYPIFASSQKYVCESE